MYSILPQGKLEKKLFDKHFDNHHDEGIYAFVWIGPEALKDGVQLRLKGKKEEGVSDHKKHDIKWSLSDFPSECRENGQMRYPLYIGKTTTLYSRIAQHLYLSAEDWKNTPKQGSKLSEKVSTYKEGYVYKPTTSCQFRSGMQHLFPDDNKADFIARLCNVELCFMPQKDVADRFYLEDLTIGYFRPWFNVDSER